MRSEKDTERKKQKKATKGQATMFGWTIGHMSDTMKIFYALLVIVIIGGIFWYLFRRVDKPKVKSPKGKKDKKDKKSH
jgi:hypothetical protein